MTTSKKQRCPACGKTSVRKRAMSTLGNIKRRTIEEKHHRFVCDECSWSGTTDDIDWNENVEESSSALEW